MVSMTPHHRTYAVAFVLALTLGVGVIVVESGATTAHKASVKPSAAAAITSIALVLDGGFVPRHRAKIVDRNSPTRLAELARLVPRTMPASARPIGCNDCVLGTLTIRRGAKTTTFTFVNDEIPPSLRALYTSLVGLLEDGSIPK